MDITAVGATVGPVEETWSTADCLLYAVGIGAGAADPLTELAFTTENAAGRPPLAFPTYAVVVAARLREIYQALGPIDWTKVVHGDQSVELFRPLATDGHVLLTTHIAGIYDKGSGAFVQLEATAIDAIDRKPVFTSRAGLFIRGAGGWGGDRGPTADLWAPEGEPAYQWRERTNPNQALIYRLSGDRNPLHSDPAVANAARFPRPILHGLCTFGFAGRGLLASVCNGDPARFRCMSARFSNPVFPGDSLITSMWLTDSDHVLFQTKLENGTVVLDHGRFSSNSL